jgi:hypothetical protein
MMKYVTCFCVAVYSGSALFAQEQKSDQVLLSFESADVGSVPQGWAVEATKQEGPLATWEVVEDTTAPDGGNVLALTKANHNSSPTFNLCWTRDARLLDGTLEVSFKANGGFIDEGGGPMWRVQDKDNYYVCRANPLEGNFRLYVVQNGVRKQLATSALEIESETWHHIRVEHRGAEIACFLNGAKLLEASDTTISAEGGVGLWTKADAATSFDALKLSR